MLVGLFYPGKQIIHEFGNSRCRWCDVDYLSVPLNADAAGTETSYLINKPGH
jgi:hypothetical protein